MMRFTLLVGGALGAVALTTAAAQAQRTPRSSAITVTRGSFAIAPFGGYLINQNLIDGPLATSLGVSSAPLYGIQGSLPLAPGASLIGAFGYSGGDLEIGLPLVGGISVGNSTTWLFDASVELRLESWEGRGKRFIPLAQLGGGALRRELSVVGLRARTTDFMVSAGVGADLPIATNMAIRLMAKDHYGRADFGSLDLGSLGTLRARTNDLHTIALSAGLRVAF